MRAFFLYRGLSIVDSCRHESRVLQVSQRVFAKACVALDDHLQVGLILDGQQWIRKKSAAVKGQQIFA